MPTGIEATGRPEEDARRVHEVQSRKVIGRASIPIDPVHIARDLGFEVYTADVEHDIAGMLVKEAGRAPAIYVNHFDSSSRQRGSHVLTNLGIT
jgi:hypothetical protein